MQGGLCKVERATRAYPGPSTSQLGRPLRLNVESKGRVIRQKARLCRWHGSLPSAKSKERVRKGKCKARTKLKRDLATLSNRYVSMSLDAIYKSLISTSGRSRVTLHPVQRRSVVEFVAARWSWNFQKKPSYR